MHHFKDFKSFAEASLDLSRPLTVLIGKNGSGKSNAIEGVELLAQITHGRPLNEITDVGREALGFEVRGGLQGAARAGRARFTLGMSLHGLGYSIEIDTQHEPSIAAEVLSTRGSVIFRAREDEDRYLPGFIHAYLSMGGKSRPQAVGLPGDRSILSQFRGLLPLSVRQANLSGDRKDKKLAQELQHRYIDANNVLSEPNRLAAEIENARLRLHSSAFELAECTKRFLSLPSVFDPNPKVMRTYERIGNRILFRSGSNLSAVLYALKNGSTEEQASLRRILGWIKQLPEEPYKSFEFVTTELNDVIFGLRETKNGPLLDARILSDGTLRCLAVLVALETAQKGSQVIVEEFDNGLHPSRVGVLTQAIWDCSNRRKLNVLVTTHNPATLDSLTEEQLAGVVLCFWDKKRKASRLLPLLELPRADVLLERGHLGDLVTRRVLEQHLMPGFEEAQKRKAMDWLSSLP